MEYKQEETENLDLLSLTCLARDSVPSDINTIKSEGDRGIFGGLGTQDMKDRLDIPDDVQLDEHLQPVLLKMKDLASEYTRLRIIKEDIRDVDTVVACHRANNDALRQLALAEGIVPEDLPPAKIRILKEKRKLLK